MGPVLVVKLNSIPFSAKPCMPVWVGEIELVSVLTTVASNESNSLFYILTFAEINDKFKRHLRKNETVEEII